MRVSLHKDGRPHKVPINQKTSRKATVVITSGLSPRFYTKITVSFSTIIQNNVNIPELKSIQAINALQ